MAHSRKREGKEEREEERREERRRKRGRWRGERRGDGREGGGEERGVREVLTKHPRKELEVYKSNHSTYMAGPVH